MKNKHTPAPWSQSHRICDDEGNYSTQVYCKEGNTIATIHWYPKPKKKIGNHVITETYREANAILIASAPELLEALNELYLRCIYLQGNLIEKALLRASDIIKKATGDE